MLYTINELRQKIFKQVFDVYEIFQNFFGEEYTDLQRVPSEEDLLHTLSLYDISGENDQYEISQEQYDNIATTYVSTRVFILVWWPEVRVTNENDKFIDIQDLYAKVEITIEGTIPYENTGFLLNRTTYTALQYESRYVHSHVPSRANNHSFQIPCLGRGPIRNTIADLHNGSEEVLWMLFCQELSQYVTVESLAGVPYRKLEEVGIGSKLLQNGFEDIEYSKINVTYGFAEHKEYAEEKTKSFVSHFLQNSSFPLCYRRGSFQCGANYSNFMITISNAFISWINQCCTQQDLGWFTRYKWIVKAIYKNGRFYNATQFYSNTPDCQPAILIFKGESKCLKIIDAEDSDHSVLLLSHKIAMFLLGRILKTINYHYNNELIINQDGSTAQPASSYQTVCYI